MHQTTAIVLMWPTKHAIWMGNWLCRLCVNFVNYYIRGMSVSFHTQFKVWSSMRYFQSKDCRMVVCTSQYHIIMDGGKLWEPNSAILYSTHPFDMLNDIFCHSFVIFSVREENNNVRQEHTLQSCMETLCVLSSLVIFFAMIILYYPASHCSPLLVNSS